jgi:hypothetical protein
MLICAGTGASPSRVTLPVTWAEADAANRPADRVAAARSAETFI